MSHRPTKYEAPAAISVPLTAAAAVLVVAGIAWITVYSTILDEPNKLTWMQDLDRWNYLIGFGLIFVGLIAASNKGTPLGRGRGVVVGMLGCFLLGLAWIVVYYFTSNQSDIPLVSDLGQLNLVVGIGFMATGFVYATKWE